MGLPEERLAVELRTAISAWSQQLVAALTEESCPHAVLDEYAVQTWELLVVR